MVSVFGSPTRQRRPEIAVVGSLNWDIRLTIERLPRSGETILSDDRRQAAGGKGANQAVAAARLGREVAMIGAVGNDAFGQHILQGLRAEGIDDNSVRSSTYAPTGLAVVLWEQPESTIIFEAGANAEVDTDYVETVNAKDNVIANSAAILCQCETPVGSLRSVVNLAQGMKILNPAPAIQLDPEVRDQFDVLIPNAFELASLADEKLPPRSISDVVALVNRLQFPGALVVTMGQQGSVAFPAPDPSARGPKHERPYTHVPALEVEAVDTTAAGDSFCAAVADALLKNESIVGAAKFATRVAAITIARHGALESLPSLRDIGEGDLAPKPAGTEKI